MISSESGPVARTVPPTAFTRPRIFTLPSRIMFLFTMAHPLILSCFAPLALPCSIKVFTRFLIPLTSFDWRVSLFPDLPVFPKSPPISIS